MIRRLFQVLASFLLLGLGTGTWFYWSWVHGPVPTGAPPNGLELPSARKFRMAFQFQPPAWSPEAMDRTFDFVTGHADGISHFLDDGVPWPEALAGTPYDPEYEAYLAKRAAARRPGQFLVLAVNPVGSDRRTLAPYMGPGGAQDLPGPWGGRSLDHPEVIEAYGNYLDGLVRRFRPDHLIFAFEVNSAFEGLEDPLLPPLLRLLEATRERLAREHPSLPLSLEMALGDAAYQESREAVTRRLLGLSDAVVASTYPYLFDSVVRNGSEVPGDWFERLHRLAPEKPFAIGETAFLGGHFTHPEKGMSLPFLEEKLLIAGSEATQADYVRFLLEEAQRRRALWVSWWVWRDLDELWEQLRANPQPGILSDPMAAQWNHTGMQDRYGRSRTAFLVWEAWRALPLVGRGPQRSSTMR